jgi:hypothetical protein
MEQESIAVRLAILPTGGNMTGIAANAKKNPRHDSVILFVEKHIGIVRVIDSIKLSVIGNVNWH